jgi:membrane-bound lytic murein transglycosylase D
MPGAATPEVVTDQAVVVVPREPGTDSLQHSLPVTENPPLVDSATANAIEVIVPAKKGEHVVLQGETLYAIAKQYGVGVMDLVNWNQLNLQDGIRPGQILKTAEVQPVEESVTTPEKLAAIEHEVKATDTLYGIARKYNVTIKELMEWNNKKDFTLTVGEKLKVNPR